MKRPSTLTFLIGNPLSAIAIFIGAAIVVWQWWHGRAADLAAILAGIGLIITMNAADQVTNYHHWKREWDAMAGKQPGIAIPPHAWQGMRILFGLILWGVMAYGLHTMKPGPNDALIKLSFWGGTAVLVFGAVYRALKAGRSKASQRPPSADIPVTGELGIPGHSPSVASAAQSLPAYCLRVP